MSFLAFCIVFRSILYAPFSLAYSAGSGKRSFWIRVTYSTSIWLIMSSRVVFSVTGIFVLTSFRMSSCIFSVSGEIKCSSTL